MSQKNIPQELHFSGNFINSPQITSFFTIFLKFSSILMICFLLRIHWEVMFITFLAIDKIHYPFQDIQTLVSDTNYRSPNSKQYLKIEFISENVIFWSQFCKGLLKFGALCRIALNPGSSNEDWFSTSTDPILQKAWHERIEPYLDEFAKYGYFDMINLLDGNGKPTAIFSWESNIV